MMSKIYDSDKKRIIWKTVNKAIKDLEKNQDIEVTTVPEYVTGYIVKSLAKKFKFAKKVWYITTRWSEPEDADARYLVW